MLNFSESNDNLLNIPKIDLKKKLYDKAIRGGIPLSGTFELTPRCNLDCKMCYIRMTKEQVDKIGREYSADEWVQMGKVCKDAGMLYLLITGGDPFVRQDFKEIYTNLCKMGLVVSINTNGILIDEDTIEWLKQYPPEKIHISVYGGCNETYNKLCGNAKGYDQVRRAIDLLIAAGIPIDLNATFTPYNVDDMEDIFKFAKSRNLDIKVTVYSFPPLRKAELPTDYNRRFTPEEAGRAYYKAQKLNMSDMEYKVMLFKMHQESDIHAGTECIKNETMGCIAGKCSFWITWDGKMTPCGLMNEPITHPFAEGFDQSWKYISEKCQEIFLPAECSVCENRKECTICAALAMAEGNGDFTCKPEYLCRLTEAYKKLCMKDKGERK